MDPPMYLARTDISQNKKLAEQFKIKNREVPKIIFFRNTNDKVPYTGGKTKDKILYWLSKVNGEKSLELSCDDLKAKINDDGMNYILAYFGDIASDLFNKAHEPFAIHDDKIQFVHNSNSECA